MIRKIFRALRVLPLLLLMGFVPRCDNIPLTLSCDTISVQLDPGTCIDLPNPCADHQWVRLDAFRLCDNLDGLFVQTQREPRAREICADASVGTLIDVPFQYYYVRPQNEAGVGEIRVTVGSTPLLVSASATPATIPVGGSSQLDAVATGGRPPYAFFWSPVTGLSATDIANPVASPSMSTQYTVVVIDDNGLIAGAAVVVNVGLSAVASANPSAIDPGRTSDLFVTVSGGMPPYTFSWTPFDTLSAPDIATPTASPLVTTQYTVTVTDFLGATALASVVVNVNLTASASANPATISPGGQSQLDVAVSGGSPPYSFSWSPAASLDNPTLQNPIATPNATTTYDLLVTDKAGQQAFASVTVDVIAPSLTSCFTITVINPFNAQGNGSCSSGAIVEYRWWSNFLSPTQPPTAVTTTPISPVFTYETPGPKVMRLEVVDGTGASHASQQAFTTL